MKTIRTTMALAVAAALLCAGQALAQATTESQPGATGSVPVAGRTNLGVAVIEMDAVISGWSVKNNLLRRAVVNEKNEKIGTVDDVIITPTADAKLSAASFAIVGVGGFLGIKRHDVVIPMEQLRLQDGQLVLPGATKEALKALRPFEYRRK